MMQKTLMEQQKHDLHLRAVALGEVKGEMTGYPSKDKPWLKYYSPEAIASTPAECSIYQNIYRSNKDCPNDVAVIYFGKKITYGQLFSMIEQTAKALLAHQIKADDNVVLCASATPETLILILALNRIGANAVMLNPTFTEEQLAARAAETNARMLFVLDELYSRVKNILPRTAIREVVSCPAVNSLGNVVKVLKKSWKIKPKDTIPWNSFVRSGKSVDSVPEPAYNPNRSAIMVFSSGIRDEIPYTEVNKKKNVKVLEEEDIFDSSYSLSGKVIKKLKRCNYSVTP